MKAVQEIEDRIRFLLQQELDRRLTVSQEHLPARCKYHHDQPLDHRKTVEGSPNPNYNRVSAGPQLPVMQTVGVCLYGSEDPASWKSTICEDPIDAKSCAAKHEFWPGAFTPKFTPREVYDQFLKDLQSEQWVLVNLPRIHPLLWVLGAQIKVEEAPPSPPEPWSFWKVLKFALGMLAGTNDGFALPPPPPVPANSLAEISVYLPPPPDESHGP